MKSMTAPGEPFALSWKGLPAEPEQIAASGHSIVHSVKCPDDEREQGLRGSLQAFVESMDRPVG
jgi:hypothetical protein